MKTSTVVLLLGAAAAGIYFLSKISPTADQSSGGGSTAPSVAGATPAMTSTAQAQNASVNSGMTITESVHAQASGVPTMQAANVLLSEKVAGQGLLLSQGYAPYVNQATSTQRPNYVPAAGRAYRTADEIARGVGVGG